MRAIQVHQFGPPSVMRYDVVSDPKPAAGQVLVKVKAAGVNPVDTYVRDGTYGVQMPLPYIPGSELAGDVVEGPADWVGKRVFALGTAGPRLTGCYAELAVCNVAELYELPAAYSYSQGAAVPVAYGTAWRALFDRGRAEPGQLVLIHGASGGVGTAAAQLAAGRGCVVFGTASSERGRKLARDCGCAEVVDHKSHGYAQDLLAFTKGRGFDVIIEMLANVNLDRDLDLLAPGGTVVVVGNRGRIEIDPRKTMGKECNITGIALWAGGQSALQRAFAGISAKLKTGAINPIVGAELPLATAAKAHELVMQDGSHGKVVLLP
jgi:NADPH:quinone reductase